MAANSRTLINSIGAEDGMWADFGSGLLGRQDLRGRGGPPVSPGLARYDEVARGRIDHALRFTVRRTRGGFIYPARHPGRDFEDPSLPRMGMRARLRADYPVGSFPPQARVVFVALQRYGMILADNGTDWVVTGNPDPRAGATSSCSP